MRIAKVSSKHELGQVRRLQEWQRRFRLPPTETFKHGRITLVVASFLTEVGDIFLRVEGADTELQGDLFISEGFLAFRGDSPRLTVAPKRSISHLS
jgi:hypothetical protein